MNKPTLEYKECFIYSSYNGEEIDEDNSNKHKKVIQTAIRLYGITSEGDTMCIQVCNYNRWYWLQLPEEDGLVSITEKKIQATDKLKRLLTEVNNKLSYHYCGSRTYFYGVCNKKCLCFINDLDKLIIRKKRPLYNSDGKVVDGKFEYEKKYYVRLDFKNSIYAKSYAYRLRNGLRIGGVEYKFNIQEDQNSLGDLLKFMTERKIKTTGWVKFRGEMQPCQFTKCKYVYNVDYRNIFPLEKNDVPIPKMMSFDIEVYSSRKGKFPSPSVPEDIIFQVSCVFFYGGNVKKYLLTLGEVNPIDDVIVKTYKKEFEMLKGFNDLVCEENPIIIIGYNIFGFDFNYIMSRMEYKTELDEVKKKEIKYTSLKFNMFRPKSDVLVEEIEWESSAYQNQKFTFPNPEGRIVVDLYPIIKRDYKLSNYKLETVSKHFLGADKTKDPVTVNDIFEAARSLKSNPNVGKITEVGKYCVQDSYITGLLFEKLFIWYTLVENAKINHVPILYLYTRGQQIKIYNSVYTYCYHNNIIVNKSDDMYSNTKYEGATVLDPVVGIHKNILPFDFASLYPTIIIAHNIDYTTLVPEKPIDKDDIKKVEKEYVDGVKIYKPPPLKNLNSIYNITDEMCNVFEFDDHENCEHSGVSGTSEIKRCGPIKYRFIKPEFTNEGLGVVPSVIQNLLKARSDTRKQIKEYEETIEKLGGSGESEEINKLNNLCNVLDKRQLAYKVCANSMYGAMGVKKGYLPLLPGARCVTAKGRESINRAATFIESKYGGKICYGDTDSCFVHFPHYPSDVSELLKLGSEISKDTETIFPKPMKLEFEGKIYHKYFILTKKRYFAQAYNKDGTLSDKLIYKGVVLSRRDNCEVLRKLYKGVIDIVFSSGEIVDKREKVIDTVVDFLITMRSRSIKRPNPASGEEKKLSLICEDELNESHYSKEDNFIIGTPLSELIEKEKPIRIEYRLPEFTRKEISNYLRELNKYKEPIDPKMFVITKGLNKKAADKDYTGISQPGHVALYERMTKRGELVDIGSRLEYIFTTRGDIKTTKQDIKTEDIDYAYPRGRTEENCRGIQIDYLYYIDKQIKKPIDELLNILYWPKNEHANDWMMKNNGRVSKHDEISKSDKIKITKSYKGDFVSKFYKIMIAKENVIKELKSCFKPTIILKSNDVVEKIKIRTIEMLNCKQDNVLEFFISECKNYNGCDETSRMLMNIAKGVESEMGSSNIDTYPKLKRFIEYL